VNRAELERLELARFTDTRPRPLCLVGCAHPEVPEGLGWDHRDLLAHTEGMGS
jgi:hypothetical protein